MGKTYGEKNRLEQAPTPTIIFIIINVMNDEKLVNYVLSIGYEYFFLRAKKNQI